MTDPDGLAEDLARRIRRRWRADVVAIGATGSLAHRDAQGHPDDRDGADVELVVATYQPGSGPTPIRRRVEGHLVAVEVASQRDLLARARTLTVRWPLRADRLLHVRPLDEDSDWLTTVRDAHLTRLAEAGSREFSTLARDAWCEAESLLARAVESGQWHDEDGALLLLAEARIAAAVTDGLLTRTYFRSTADAARRTDVVGLDLVELRDRVRQQATELDKRGRPVDTSLAELFR